MLAFAILGLAGCAMALIAVALDWRERRVYTLDTGKVAAALERQLFKEPKA